MKINRITKELLIVPMVILVLVLCACQQDPANPEEANEWPTATPQSQGLDGGVLTHYSSLAANGEYGEMHSLLVIRHGYLVHEAYYRGFDGEQLHRIYSVTKTITAVLIGMALERGNIAGILEKVLSFFPQYQDIANMNAWKGAITLRNLLTMQAGFLWDEESTPSTSPQNSLFGLYRAPDWYKYMLDQPMATNPGTTFAYNSGCSVLLGGILNRSGGISASLFAHQYLFNQIGIQQFEWDEGSPGICNTGWGLWLRPRDMAKFGELLLRSGNWQGNQVVQQSWVQTLLSCQVSLDASYGYGFQIWMMPLRPNPAVNDYGIKIAWGYGGQFIFIIPSLDMVVVSTAGNFINDGGAIDFIQAMLASAVQNQ
jgi:CubicO group peptidase (beta-lactamase class C family)